MKALRICLVSDKEYAEVSAKAGDQIRTQFTTNTTMFYGVSLPTDLNVIYTTASAVKKALDEQSDQA